MAGAGKPKTGGRAKGVANKTTSIAKSVIAEAADALGGKDRLIAWVKEAAENEKVFWGTIYPKLLPLQVTGEGGGPLETITRVELVALSSK